MESVLDSVRSWRDLTAGLLPRVASAAQLEAKRLAVDDPRNVVFDTKRLLGLRHDDETVQTDSKMLPFASAVLRRCISAASESAR